MKARLYGIPASHPVTAAGLMLDHKGIEYGRVDLIPALHKALVRALRFPGNTVPALTIGGERIQGTREISRALERIRPEPPLFPADPTEREAVEKAERWGDEVLQVLPRRITWWALRRDRSSVPGFLQDARLGLPKGILARTSPPLIWLAGRVNHSTDANVREVLSALPAALDRIDAWIADGVLAGEQLNAADFQIAPTVRLLESFADLAPAIEGRPAGGLAQRVQPSLPGQIGPVFPAQWLAPMRASVPV